MVSNVVDLRPVLADLSTHSVRDVRVRKSKETGKIILRFKVYGLFAPSVFDECRMKLILPGAVIAGVIRVVQSEVARSLVYSFEFQADDPTQLKDLYFSEDLVQWCNVSGMLFELGGEEYIQPNPFYRANPYIHAD
ncbi:MAG: hypothetical protein WCW31_02925 [Patescibacteria group bacterium]|jgi:hypothetical protein